MFCVHYVGRVDAEHVVERAVPADVVDAVDPVAAPVRLPEQLAGLGAAAAAEQRHGKAPAGRLAQRCVAPPLPALERAAGRHGRRLQRAAAHRDGRPQVPLAQYHAHALDAPGPGRARRAGRPLARAPAAPRPRRAAAAAPHPRPHQSFRFRNSSACDGDSRLTVSMFVVLSLSMLY